MNDDQVMHAVSLDDAYRVERVLASGRGTVTEKVSLDSAGPFVRKKMPSAAANRGVWAAIASSPCRRLPHVVATYELPDQFVAVYEYVPGETLESYLAEHGRLGRDEVLAVALDICEGVAALHSLGIMHRDISLANVVMAADGAHLIDLGNAQPIARPPEHVSTPFGTWGFAAPEQYGFAKTDVRSDVYSIGRLLGSLLAGVSPADESYDKTLADDAVDPGLRAVVERACAFEPSARYQTVRELQNTLQSYAATHAAAKEPPARQTPHQAAQRPTSPPPIAVQSGDARGSKRVAPKGIAAILPLVVSVAIVSLAALAMFSLENDGDESSAASAVFDRPFLGYSVSDESVGTNAEADDTPRTDIRHVKDYIGMNAASIGYAALGGDRYDRYDNETLKVVYVADTGEFVDPEDEEQLKEYVVVGQSLKPDTELRYSYPPGESISPDQNYDEVVLAVAKIGQKNDEPVQLTEIKPSNDRYTQYVRDYVGRNLASCGYIAVSGRLTDSYGHSYVMFDILTDDGSYVDVEDENSLAQYVVTGQNVQPNTEFFLTYARNENGQEEAYLVSSTSVDSITLNVTKLK